MSSRFGFAPLLALVALLLLPFDTVALLAPAEASTTPVYRAGNGTVVKQRLRYAIGHLPGVAESNAGYARDLFTLWTDADSDCQDTRAEVLVQESQVTTDDGCTITRGRWQSYYDRLGFTDPSGMDIDHLVPLAEAWGSGAHNWDYGRREAYANDLADSRSLVAVSASANRSKSDRDPAEWLPRYDKCRYVRQWVAVKIRWRLSVNAAERSALTRVAMGCSNDVITVARGTVVQVSPGSAPTTGTSGGSTGSALDPRFATCTDAKSHGYGPYYQGTDPEYAWYRDSDGDGIVCE